jgi:hypothetical protein
MKLLAKFKKVQSVELNADSKVIKKYKRNIELKNDTQYWKNKALVYILGV